MSRPSSHPAAAGISAGSAGWIVVAALLGATVLPACGTAPSPTVVGPAAPSAAEERLDVFSTLQRTPRLATFSRLVVAAGLEENLRHDGQWTVLAPVDEAFERLPQGTLDTLLSPEGFESLRALVKNHLLEGVVDAAELRKRADVESIHGGRAHLVAEGGQLRIEGGQLLGVDREATNGMIHVIDVVLVPKVAAQP